MLKKFSNYGLEHWGSDTQVHHIYLFILMNHMIPFDFRFISFYLLFLIKGVEKTRSFLLNWISFLCRYVPVGLLEKLPTRINERPPAFYGRFVVGYIFLPNICRN